MGGYAGPSNLWRDDGARADTVAMTMIYGQGTALFRTAANGTLHNWTMVNSGLYPVHGGGGGLFLRLPSAPPMQRNWRRAHRTLGHRSPPPPEAPTHMLQIDAPGHPDGVSAFVVGRFVRG